MKLKIFVAWLTGAVTALLVVAVWVGVLIQQGKRNEQRDREGHERLVRLILSAPFGVGFTSPDVMQMPEASGILVETLLNDDRVTARRKAVGGLRYHQKPEVVSALCQALRSDPDSQVRSLSLHTLVKFSECEELSVEEIGEISQCVTSALNDSSTSIREIASSTLKLFKRGGSVAF